MAIEILEVMDDCVVALEAAKLLRRAKERAEVRFSAPAVTADPALSAADGTVHLNHYWGPLNLFDGDMDLDFAFQLAGFDGRDSFTADQPWDG